MIPIGTRLRTAASMVRGGVVLADIGTDHAYLPVCLVQDGLVPRVIASDIGEGPLLNAKNTVDAYGCADRIELRISDGLNNFSPGEAGEICICGMGGNLIADILTAAPWVKTEGMHLVLQPMTHAEDVRRYLCENGFVIECERCVRDGGRVYLLLSAAWKNVENTFETGYYYFGETLHGSDESAVITKKQYQRVIARFHALRQVDRNPEEQALLAGVLDYYEREKRK